jgi:hypothetical protein
MKKKSDTALRVLQLLLRCGMICQEELDIVLEMMVRAQGNGNTVSLTTEDTGARSGQSTLVFDID